MFINYGGFVTGPSDEPAEMIARDFLKQNADLMGLSEADLASLQLSKQYETEHDGAQRLFFTQSDGDREVYGAVITFTLDDEGRIALVGGPYFPGAVVGDKYEVTAAEAVAVAVEDVGATVEGSLTLTSFSDGVSSFSNTVAEGVRAPTDHTAELVTYPLGQGQSAVLAWKTVTEINPFAWYETIVDATTGEVLFRFNQYSDSGPEGNVFQEQHPDVTGAMQQITPFSGIDGSWVSGTTTEGNNVTAYSDRFDADDPTNPSDTPPTTPAMGDPAYQHFNYTFTDAWRQPGPDQGTLAAITTDHDPTVTQLFYYNNVMHDYLYNLGFDEPAGNFQVDNFGRGGSGGDPVNAEAHDGFGTGTEMICLDGMTPILCRNNANFRTQADGIRPRMQMFMWDGSRPFRDGSMDGDVIAHEYGHGVSNRLVGGGMLGSGAQTGALGEGWSDTISVYKWDDAVVGEYVTGNATTGIRGVAYDASTLVYSDFSSSSSVHTNGRIWASATVDMRTALINRYGDATGRLTAALLIIDGMKNTISSPTYLDARDGILTADMLTNASANFCLLWGVFAGREMGFDASSPSQTSVTAGTAGHPDCIPTADAGGPYETDEGVDVMLDGTLSMDPVAATVPGLTYDWDLDNDGMFDDATGPTPTFDMVGQDGVFTVSLQVTASDGGFTDSDSTTVTVHNVAPSVALGSDAPQPENSPVTVSGIVSDPGWLDLLTATIDWGDGSVVETIFGVLENDRPLATLTFDIPHTYGDNGLFTAEVCGSDDDTTTCETILLEITNVDPTAVIDESGTVLLNGTPTIVAHAGDPVDFSAQSQDPGSDDLTYNWDWDDGPPAPDVMSTHLVNSPNPDPFPSPSIQPRDEIDMPTHTFADACLYEVGLLVVDDDGGTASDSVAVIITGNADEMRTTGYWYQQYRDKKNKFFDDDTLNCYLEIAAHASAVFDEKRSAMTFDEAKDVLRVNGTSDMTELLERQLLAAWFNFANGAVGLDELVDTDGDSIADTTFIDAVVAAESVRCDPMATDAELEQQKDILESINLS
jgi:hypothetical protein